MARTCAQVLAGKGPRLMLDLPAAAFAPELEPYIAAVMRHILEDPATLQVRWCKLACCSACGLISQLLSRPSPAIDITKKSVPAEKWVLSRSI